MLLKREETLKDCARNTDDGFPRSTTMGLANSLRFARTSGRRFAATVLSLLQNECAFHIRTSCPKRDI